MFVGSVPKCSSDKNFVDFGKVQVIFGSARKTSSYLWVSSECFKWTLSTFKIISSTVSIHECLCTNFRYLHDCNLHCLVFQTFLWYFFWSVLSDIKYYIDLAKPSDWNKLTWVEPLIQIEYQYIVSSQLQKKTCDLEKFQSKPEPAIWSHDTGQWIPCFNRY